MTKTFYISYDGDNSYRPNYDIANTLHGAKMIASKRVEFGMDVTILDENKEPIYFRRFWQNLNRFGWDKWKRVGEP